MDALKLDEIEQISDQKEVPGPTSDDGSKARPIELCRRSTKSREYWHSDTIPLEKTWNHMKDALVIVDDFTGTRMIHSESMCSDPIALCIWTTIMLTKQTRMSRLRHVYIYVMHVTSNVGGTWYGTTSAVQN